MSELSANLNLGRREPGGPPGGVPEPPKSGWDKLRCPHCGEPILPWESDGLNVHIDSRQFECVACDASITRADVATVHQLWMARFDWLDAMPYEQP